MYVYLIYKLILIRTLICLLKKPAYNKKHVSEGYLSYFALDQNYRYKIIKYYNVKTLIKKGYPSYLDQFIFEDQGCEKCILFYINEYVSRLNRFNKIFKYISSKWKMLREFKQVRSIDKSNNPII